LILVKNWFDETGLQQNDACLVKTILTVIEGNK